MAASTYPKSFQIETDDGEGEAVKPEQGAAWDISYPTGGFRWFGTPKQVQSEIRKRLRLDYPGLPAAEVVRFPNG